jgi:hypothetical protein
LNKAVPDPKHRAVIPDLLDETAFREAMRAAAKKAEIEAKEEAEAQKQGGTAEKQVAPATRAPEQGKGGPEPGPAPS